MYNSIIILLLCLQNAYALPPTIASQSRFCGIWWNDGNKVFTLYDLISLFCPSLSPTEVPGSVWPVYDMNDGQTVPYGYMTDSGVRFCSEVIDTFFSSCDDCVLAYTSGDPFAHSYDNSVKQCVGKISCYHILTLAESSAGITALSAAPSYSAFNAAWDGIFADKYYTTPSPLIYFTTTFTDLISAFFITGDSIIMNTQTDCFSIFLSDSIFNSPSLSLGDLIILYYNAAASCYFYDHCSCTDEQYIRYKYAVSLYSWSPAFCTSGCKCN
jgi:hypothetical protein